MNIELLKKIATKLKRMRHKKHFDMDAYYTETDCGASACIAGWACILEGHEEVNSSSTYWNWRRVAMAALGLTHDEAERLFYPEGWPRQFRQTPKGRRHTNPQVYNDPKVAAARIMHFIETKGRE